MKNKTRARSLTELAKLPAELVPGVPKLTLSGGGQALIENHAGLKSYLSDCVEIRGRNGFLRIRGQALELAAMTKTEIVIRGIIVAIELC